MQPSPRFALLLILACAVPYGCSRESPAPAAARSAESRRARLSMLPIEIRVRQRSTTDVAGSGGALRLTIDDVTRGQVMASLADADGRAVLSPISLTPGAGATFAWRGESYALELKALENSLIGTDYATFVISGSGQARSEAEKIERLLAGLESMQGAAFIRNGSEHSPKDAAAHLRRKWKSHEVATARQFVAEVATASSTSGEAYQVRFADGRLVPLGAHLQAKLVELEKGP
jgi:Family of unknown function (DUF5329)